jgi:threonine dehydrogenase-like Zn-dependent dehydrogenase
MQTEALWYVGGGRMERRVVALPAPATDQIRVRALYSGISRGTERLVFEGRVPASEYERMRCPFQEGAFPFPVKYGYAYVGEIEDGPRAGERIFALHPHQRHTVVPASAAHTLPKNLPLKRAVLIPNMETALNVMWDAEIKHERRALIIGAGVLGLLTAAVVRSLPGVEVTLVDIDPSRAAPAAKMGADFALPDAAPRDQDLVIHTSASEAGLRLALLCAGNEAKIVEASWFGDKQVSLPLGEAFHARRLKLISSQVGQIAPSHRAEWTYARRLQAAMAFLQDDKFDALIETEISFDEAPERLPEILDDRRPRLMTVLRY